MCNANAGATPSQTTQVLDQPVSAPADSPFLSGLKKFGTGFAANGGFTPPQSQQGTPNPVQVMNDTPASQGNPALNSILAQIMQRGGY